MQHKIISKADLLQELSVNLEIRAWYHICLSAVVVFFFFFYENKFLFCSIWAKLFSHSFHHKGKKIFFFKFVDDICTLMLFFGGQNCDIDVFLCLVKCL